MARPKGIWTPDVVRERIRTTKLIQRLQNHALGEVEMSPTQIKATEILLKKRLPDLSAVEHTGTTTHKHVSEFSEAELAAELEALRAVIVRATEADESAPDDSGIH
jgi:hypothetical protein